MMGRFVLGLVLASLLCGCRVPLSSAMPAELDLDPQWEKFEPPLTETEAIASPRPLPTPSEPARQIPADIPRDPLAGVAPDGTRGSDLPPLPYAPGPGGPMPATTAPRVSGPAPVVADPVDPVPTTPSAPAVAEGDPDMAAQPLDLDTPDAPSLPAAPTGSGGAALPPAGPGTTPDPFGDLPAEPGPKAPGPKAPGEEPPVAVPGRDPFGDLPGKTEQPRTPVRPPAPPAEPARVSDDLGVPPGGAPPRALAPAAPATPRVSDTPGPVGPVVSPPVTPTPGRDVDPFGDLGGNTPKAPSTTPASPSVDRDPFGDAADPGPAAPPAGMERDPFSGSGNAAPVVPSLPGLPDAPTGPGTAPSADVGGAGADPFADAAAGASITWQSDDPEDRAQEQATRLTDDPGNPRHQGYPREILMLAESWVALREGPRPLVVIFYDDAIRTSDLMAAEVLPVLAKHQRGIDIVAIDRNPAARIDKYQEAVVRRLLGDNAEDVPVLIVQDPKRKFLLVRYSKFPAEELDRVLATGRAGTQATRPQPAVTPRTPALPRNPGPTFPATSTPSRPAAHDNLPPAGGANDPLGLPPTGTPPEPPRPAVRDPSPTFPRTPDAGARPGVSNPEPPVDRTQPVFSAPRAEEARRHAARLRENPDGAIRGYPRQLLPSARPELALQPGHRPVVIVFYDDSSRASNLQAADVLPVLVDAQGQADIITIDVSKSAKRTAAETKVVKPYYPGSVPAIVVLSAGRAPVKLWFQRTSARALRAAISQAGRVR